jgi:subtilisin family serine protease
MAAKSENYVGGATGATFMLYISEHSPTEYRVEEYLWAFAAERADSAGADIITSSLGYNEFDDPSMDYEYADLDGQTSAISKAASWAFEKGILVVVAAGNIYPGSTWTRIAMPADAENVMAVGSVQENYKRAASSLMGPSADNRVKPDVMALGAGASIVLSNGTISSGNGTSLACPQVASLAAGIWQLKPDLTATELLTLIRQSGSQYFTPDNEKGYGIPTYQAIKNILESATNETELTVYPNPIVSDYLNISVTPADGSIVSVKVISLHGQLVYSGSYVSNWQSAAFDLSGIPSGTFIVKIDAGKRAKTFRVVKP